MTNHPNRSRLTRGSPEWFAARRADLHQTQAKHTPGPWHFRKGYLVRGKYLGCIEIAPNNAPAFALIPPGREDVREANAHLIAAAPELLAALKAALDYIEDDCAGNDATTFPPVFHEIRAAIAKAEGH